MELQQGSGGDVVTMKLLGANPGTHAVGLDKQADVSNYFLGNAQSRRHTDIANDAEVDDKGVYRGVNVAYQVVDGVQHAVASQFVIGAGGRVGFQVGHYDHSNPLVIDPVLSLSYSTYLGGAGALTKGDGIAVDSTGDAYVTGVTLSPKFPTTKGAFQTSGAFISTIGLGAFVTKFNAAGSALAYSTFLGGISPTGIAVDSGGDAYVTGATYGAPPLKNALQANAGGGGDAFVTKLNAAGSALVYSTYLGGSGQDNATDIAIDGSGDVYVTGDTVSTNFPTTPGSLQPGLGAEEAFVSELNPTGSALVYSTYLGGGDEDEADGIAVDVSGDAYVTGFSFSLDFPTRNAYQPQRTAQTTKHAAIGDALATKITSN
jgi:hypothetical protein